jgi:hypothetical protein
MLGLHDVRSEQNLFVFMQFHFSGILDTTTKKLASPTIAGKIFSPPPRAPIPSIEPTDEITFEAAFLTIPRISRHTTFAVELPLPTTTPVPQSQHGCTI